MSAAETSPYITFFVGEDQYAVDAADVSEIFRRPRITRVPVSYTHLRAHET